MFVLCDGLDSCEAEERKIRFSMSEARGVSVGLEFGCTQPLRDGDEAQRQVPDNLEI